MIEISKNPNTPYLAHPRGPHFTLLSNEYLTEDKDGNDSIKMPLDLFLAYLNEEPSDKIRHEAVALVTNNNGMTLVYHARPGPQHTVQSAWQAAAPVVHPDGSLKMELAHVARILAQNPFPEVKAQITELLQRMNIVANLERLSREFCKNCRQAQAFPQT